MINSKKRPIVTYTVSVICILIFIGIRFTGLENQAESAILLGAYYKPFILAGEWWRLLTVGFVHIQAMHLMMNILSFISLGQSLEGILSKWKYLLVLVLSIIGGSMVQFLSDENTVGVGLSGGLYGLLGVYTYLMLVSGMINKPEIRGSLLRVFAINILINFMPNVSFHAHLGGFIVGMLMGVVYFPRRDMPNLSKLFIPVIIVYFIVLGFMDAGHTYIPSSQIYLGTDIRVLQKYNEIGLEDYSTSIQDKLIEIYQLNGE